ncbi:hypothetical protein PICSAR30_04510 [Mycobacterium avium subsp. paratuberculosis]|nr:hypothetical protein PICSAR18_04590 [Mycobacterium avium subsp. paratuberculosis]CAG7284329.1 hypothetical protein PICSAR30_04510 [Mycobacterium avium subsp. paratuberculosis]
MVLTTPGLSFQDTTSGSTRSPLVEVTTPGKATVSSTSASGSVSEVRSARPSRSTRLPLRRSDRLTPAASEFMLASCGSSANVRSENTAWEPT